jgi:hypothetical protein
MSACDEIRRRLLSEPKRRHSEVIEHLATCAACSAYAQSLQHFEGRVERALRVDLPSSGASNVTELAPAPQRRRAVPRWLAVAASVLIATGAVSLWLSWPEPVLARDVVDHIEHEPDSWSTGTIPATDTRLSSVLSDAGVQLKADSPAVSYARSCLFRGHVVPHLVVQMPQGPVTVMILSHENVPSAVQFDEEGYHGMIVPVDGHGSVAVIMRAHEDLASISQALMRDLIWPATDR